MEEVVLWRAIATTVDTRRAGSVLPDEPALPIPQPERPTSDRPSPQPPMPLLPRGPQRTPVLPLADLDRRTRQKITRGRVAIERRIDLHGMTQATAHSALRGFLRQAQADDLRLVLVVTGKGDRSRGRHDGDCDVGVLRRVVPHWLREADLRSIVLGFEPAGLVHGGGGALYIRLRRWKSAT